MALSRTEDQVNAALRAVDEAQATPVEKAEMLMEVAVGLQQRPKVASDLHAATRLYRLALEVCPREQPLLAARIGARMATALIATPADDHATLEDARDALELALVTLTAEGLDEEVAEAEMNLGLTLQNLAGVHRARIRDCISAYQRSLRTFNKTKHPKEFAILQNNLATAFLSIPFTDDKGKLREALAVQAFEEGLSVVNLIDHPSEFAMLQNNLGNALQYVSSSHRVENSLRALDAYDEALKVRTRRDTPVEYANTISNKANCLSNLPDDAEKPDSGNAGNLAAAIALYHEAGEIFLAAGDKAKAETVMRAIAELEEELRPQMRHANGKQ